MKPIYRVKKDKAGEWRWIYRAGNAKTVAMSSEGYINCTDAVHSAELLRGKNVDTEIVIVR